MKGKINPYPILYLHHTGHFGGAENSLLHLVARLDSDLFYPIFLCPLEGEFAERLVEMGVQVIPNDFGRLREIGKLVKSISTTCMVARSNSVALIHSNGPQTNIPSGLAGRLLNIPTVWHARNLLRSGMVDIDRLFGFLPKKIICNSEAIKLRFIGRKTEQIAVTIINCVDLKDYDNSISKKIVREQLGIPLEARVVGMTSRLSLEKGQITLLEAVSRLKSRFPDLWVLIVGGHVFESDAWVPDFLQRKALDLDIADRVVFTGFQRDVTKIYAGMDIFILGTDAEPCGRVIFEAMAMSKPVIGTNSGGTPEIVVDGKTGYLYKYGDVQALAERIVRLFDQPEFIKKMGSAGRKRIEENFTIDKYIEKTQRNYLSLIEANPWE